MVLDWESAEKEAVPLRSAKRSLQRINSTYTFIQPPSTTTRLYTVKQSYTLLLLYIGPSEHEESVSRRCSCALVAATHPILFLPPDLDIWQDSGV